MKILIVLQIICTLVSGFSQVFNILDDLNENVKFTLYGKRGCNSCLDYLKVDDRYLLKKSLFNANRPTVLITHGYDSSDVDRSVALVRDAFLKKRDFNVITVDWSSLSEGSYVIARLMVSRIGGHIGKLINFLYKNKMNPDTTVLIGHSLGAHIMGFAGQTAKPKVHHLIGLDPAWPLFYTSTIFIDHRISADDAQHVEIIHTNGGTFGSSKAWGHYDFYPNGGSHQNGCDNEWFTTCSHSRAYEYLAEQIKEQGCNFVAVKCESYINFQNGTCATNKDIAIMGSLDKTGVSKGSYYLNTNTKTPFALGASQWAKISKRRLKNVFCK